MARIRSARREIPRRNSSPFSCFINVLVPLFNVILRSLNVAAKFQPADRSALKVFSCFFLNPPPTFFAVLLISSFNRFPYRFPYHLVSATKQRVSPHRSRTSNFDSIIPPHPLFPFNPFLHLFSETARVGGRNAGTAITVPFYFPVKWSSRDESAV